MNSNFLIIEDHEDVFENLERKILREFPLAKITIASTCDEGFTLIKKSLLTQPYSLLILDLTFTIEPFNAQLKDGIQVLSALKAKQITLPTIVYSSHNDMQRIHTVINSYKTKSYVLKTSTSNKELLFAIKEVLEGNTYYSKEVQQLLNKRVTYDLKLDDVDMQIIKLLPTNQSIESWKNQVFKKGKAYSYRGIKKRIDKLSQLLDVSNQKELVLKLQELGLL
ncbi:response regulator [uncultured Lacinutrix sp.]|uniref:response regulator n=1 Tax=uncultured Lacinutrix sp. TaxID=574032 RepID=UPI002625C0D6|nr:response regulator [uncultured Lacinutrix sp.]